MINKNFFIKNTDVFVKRMTIRENYTNFEFLVPSYKKNTKFIPNKEMVDTKKARYLIELLCRI